MSHLLTLKLSCPGQISQNIFHPKFKIVNPNVHIDALQYHTRSHRRGGGEVGRKTEKKGRERANRKQYIMRRFVGLLSNRVEVERLTTSFSDGLSSSTVSSSHRRCGLEESRGRANQ
ncbi:unnamed protein product [Lactuca saligna]|uniref:Uncharacterized protein n=1 Tax=Lactuca saligna TaxID=75948 RepID=A0AA35ZKU4_LACSI|nr:unnamed protein product [Lactuca saligna]